MGVVNSLQVTVWFPSPAPFPSCEARGPGPRTAQLQAGCPQRTAEATLQLIHFHTCWSLVRYLTLEGKRNPSASTKLSTVSHQQQTFIIPHSCYSNDTLKTDKNSEKGKKGSSGGTTHNTKKEKEEGKEGSYRKMVSKKKQRVLHFPIAHHYKRRGPFWEQDRLLGAAAALQRGRERAGHWAAPSCAQAPPNMGLS